MLVEHTVSSVKNTKLRMIEIKDAIFIKLLLLLHILSNYIFY